MSSSKSRPAAELDTSLQLGAELGASLDAQLVPPPPVEVRTNCDIPSANMHQTNPRRPMIDACTTQINRQPRGRAQHALAYAWAWAHARTRTHARIACTTMWTCARPLSEPESMAVSFMHARPTPPVAGIAGIVSDRTRKLLAKFVPADSNVSPSSELGGAVFFCSVFAIA